MSMRLCANCSGVLECCLSDVGNFFVYRLLEFLLLLINVVQVLEPWASEGGARPPWVLKLLAKKCFFNFEG